MKAVVLCVFAVLIAALAVSAAPLRGSFDLYQSAPAAQQSAPVQQGDLISFLQQHQRAYAAQSARGQAVAAPSQAAQQAAAQTIPAGANEAGADGVLAAIEGSTPHHSLVQTNAQAQVAAGAQAGAQAQVSEAGEDGDGEPFGPCKTCVFVLERIKKGSNMLLPAICSELYHKYPDAYALCHQVLNALSINGNNVRYWLFEGCFKYEIYQSKEWIKPCPSHVMCSVLKDLSAEPFCPALPMENPFKEGDE